MRPFCKPLLIGQAAIKHPQWLNGAIFEGQIVKLVLGDYRGIGLGNLVDKNPGR